MLVQLTVHFSIVINALLSWCIFACLLLEGHFYVASPRNHLTTIIRNKKSATVANANNNTHTSTLFRLHFILPSRNFIYFPKPIGIPLSYPASPKNFVTRTQLLKSHSYYPTFTGRGPFQPLFRLRSVNPLGQNMRYRSMRKFQ